MPNLATVTLPAGLTSIPINAFANSAQLKTVNFKTTDANNKPSAKEGAENAITLPTGLTSIGQNAFTGTTATTVDLSKVTGLTMIDNYVFKDMPNLTTVTLPSGLTTINTSAFQGDAALKKLTQSNPSQARDQETTPTEGTAKFGKSLTTIQQNAFYGTGFSTVDLSEAGTASGGASQTTTLSVGSGAFTNMAALATVMLPATTTNINPAYFGNPATGEQKLNTIKYGTDSSGTGTATITLSDATISSTNFSKITNNTIEIKSSVGQSSININGGVFNGNKTMTALKLSIATGTTNGNVPL